MYKIIQLFLEMAQVLWFIIHAEEMIEDIVKESSRSNKKHTCKGWVVLGWCYQNQS